MSFIPPKDMIVDETLHWRISQRVSCTIPGYLMIGAKASEAFELSDLTIKAQQEIGILLAHVTRILRADLGAERVYIGRYGHDVGHTVHFHVIPVYPWIMAAFHADPKYALEQNPNGVDLTRFIWREYCEHSSSLPCPGISIEAALATIRRKFRKISMDEIISKL